MEIKQLTQEVIDDYPKSDYKINSEYLGAVVVFTETGHSITINETISIEDLNKLGEINHLSVIKIEK